METKTFRKCIELEPSMLSKNIKNNILTKLKDIKYAKEDGYIVETLNDIKIIDNHIESTSGYCAVLVEYYVKVFEPRNGAVVKAEVDMKYGDGALLKFHDMLLWVPSIENKELNKGDIFTVKIQDVKFEKGVWKCIGVFV